MKTICKILLFFSPFALQQNHAHAVELANGISVWVEASQFHYNKKHNHKARANARTLIDTDGWLRPYLPWLKIAESSIIFDFIYLLDSIRFNIQWLTYFIYTWIGRSVGKFLPFRICLIKCPCALCRRLPLLVKPGPIYLYHPNRTHYAIKIRSK